MGIYPDQIRSSLKRSCCNCYSVKLKYTKVWEKLVLRYTVEKREGERHEDNRCYTVQRALRQHDIRSSEPSHTWERGARHRMWSVALTSRCGTFEANNWAYQIYELLGGPVRESIALYTHPDGGREPESIAARCRAIVDTGHTALKTDPFPRHPEEANGYLSGQMDTASEQHRTDVIAAIREAVGPKVEILIDCHGRFDIATAIRLVNRLAPYNNWLVRGACSCRELQRFETGP